MPRYRADFEVSSTVVLPKGSAPHPLRGDQTDCEILLRNAKPDPSGHTPGLEAMVIASSDSMKSAIDEFREMLAERLDILSFVTQSSFKIEGCLRIIDWEPFQNKRITRVFKKFDPLYPPSPSLPTSCIDTAGILLIANKGSYIQHALRYFRLGVIVNQPEEQFQYFWLAVECVADGRKNRHRVPIVCYNCNNALVCSNCHEKLTRSPPTAEAMRDLFRVTVRPDPDGIYKELSGLRNKLFHGGSSFRKAVAKTGKQLSDIVDTSGILAWHSIMASLEKTDNQLNFGHHDGTFINNKMVFAGEFGFDVNQEHPSEDQIPAPEITLITSFRPDPNAS